MKSMFDFFHTQIVQGDLETLLNKYMSYFAPIQISVVHDRGEPARWRNKLPVCGGGTGERRLQRLHWRRVQTQRHKNRIWSVVGTTI